MPSSWTDAVEQATEILVDKDQLKQTLDLRAVCERELDVTFDGLCADCPFHPDHGKAHFSIYGEYLNQVGCWVCNWRGDVFDVIMAGRGTDFKGALRVARGYFDQGVTLDLDDAMTAQLLPQVSPHTWQAVIDAALDNARTDPTPLVRFLHEKGLRISASWLTSEFRVGARGGSGTVIIPHFDRAGKPLGYKERTADTVPLAAKGSRFIDLYGAWRNQNHGRVVVCEGESDTWTVTNLLKDSEWDVFGLPTGAGTPPRDHLIELLQGRQVVLAFDSDPAGLAGISRWNTRIPEARVLKLPTGMDCSSVDPRQLVRQIKEEGQDAP